MVRLDLLITIVCVYPYYFCEILAPWANYLATQQSKNKFSLHSLLENLQNSDILFNFAPEMLWS